ncbi:MAG: glycosyltransferase [Bacteroidia bacterium]|nr:glycosyltransferase [Bacteroidia bacterium]
METSSGSGGWMTSLEKEIKNQKGIQLGVCFISRKQESYKRVDSVQYFPIRDGYSGTKIGRWLVRRFDLENDSYILERAMEVINEFHPDIIHVHGTENCFGLLRARCKIPMVISIQGVLNELLPVFLGDVAAKKLRALSKIKNQLLVNDILSRWRKFKRNSYRERRIFSFNKYYIGRTEYDRSLVNSYSPGAFYFHGEELLRPVFYMKSSERIAPLKRLVLCTIIGDNLYKGYDRILKMAKILKDRNIKFEWRVIGVSEKSESVYVTEKYFKLAHSELNIQLLGSQTDREIASQLSEAMVYCHSSYLENSSNALCEAQISGLPVIAFDNGGSSSIITNGTDGILVREGDCKLFAEEIVRLSEDENRCKSLAMMAQRRAMERHNRTRVAHEYIGIYNNIRVSQSDLD